MTAHLVVSDAGFLPTTRQMALALCDELTYYLTPYWAAEGTAAGRLPWLGRQLKRRSLPPPLQSRAHSFLTANEFARVGLGRLGIHTLDRALIWRRNKQFDRQVASLITPGATVVSQYGASLETFMRGKQVSALTILDYPIARLDFTRDILAEEARLWPDFAETIVGQHALAVEREHLSRVAAEVDLADLIVVGSRFAAESFHGIAGVERVAAIPYGVDTAFFRPARRHRSTDARLRVLFAGSLTQRKGIAYLLEAFGLLDLTRFELILAGPVVGRRTALARYEDRFRHIKAVRSQDMPVIYAMADVLVLPSLVEGSALVVLEAMASGLPVIVTPNVGADAVRDGVDGFIVPIREPTEIAHRLEILASNFALRVRMGEAARERVLEYDWSLFRQAFRELVFRLPNSTDQQPCGARRVIQ